MSELCKECNCHRYHNIETDRKEEGVEIIHHSTSSVIQINFYQDQNGGMMQPDIRKSEQWMDYGIFKQLYELMQTKANGELDWLLKK